MVIVSHQKTVNINTEMKNGPVTSGALKDNMYMHVNIYTFRVSAKKKLCCTSSFGESSKYTFLMPVKPPPTRQFFSMA